MPRPMLALALVSASWLTSGCAPGIAADDAADGSSEGALRGGQATGERDRSFALVTYGAAGCSGTFVSNRALLVSASCVSQGHFVEASVRRPRGLDRATVAEVRPVGNTGLALLFMTEDLRDVEPVALGSGAPANGERVTLYALGSAEELTERFPFSQLSPAGSGTVQETSLEWGARTDYASNWGDWGGAVLDGAGVLRAVLVSRESTWLGFGGTRDLFVEVTPFVRSAVMGHVARPPR